MASLPVQSVSDQNSLIMSIQYFINNPQHSQEQKQVILTKISTYLQKVLRTAKRKTIESEPDSVLQLLQKLLLQGFTSPLLLKTEMAVDLLPFFFNLASYESSRLFIPKNTQSYEDSISQQNISKHHFPSPAFFSLSEKSAKTLLESPINHASQDAATKLTDEEKRKRINELADRIVCQILLNSKPKTLLFALSDLMLKPVNSSKRVGRILLAFGLLFRLRLFKRKKIAKYLQGSLFILGGYLKNQAKSYLKCTQDYQSQESSSKVIIEEGEKLRKLNSDDLLFFDDGAMLRACEYFVKSIIFIASFNTYSLYGGIGRKNCQFYTNYMSDMYIESKFQTGGLPPDPTLKDSLEVTHYSLLSLFDMMQYIFEHLCQFKVKGEFRIGYVATQNQQQSQFIADNKTVENPFNTNWEWLDCSQKIKKQEETKTKPIYDLKNNKRFPPLILRKLPGSLKLDWYFNIPGTSQLVCTLLHGIRRISKDPFELYKFWIVKYLQKYSKQEQNSKKKSQIGDNQNNYEKTDNYNNIGFATYFCLLLIMEERHLGTIRDTFGYQTMQQNQQFQFGAQEGIRIGGGFPIPINHEHKLKLMLPLLVVLVREPVQKPQFFNMLAFVTLERILLPFFDTEIPNIYSEQSDYLQEILLKLVVMMGARQTDCTQQESQEIRKSMALLVKKILSKLLPETAAKFYLRLMVRCENENAAGYIIDCLRIDSGERHHSLLENQNVLQSILMFALRVKNNFQDEFERIYAGVTFLKYLTLRENQMNKGENCFTSAMFKEVKKERLDKIYDLLNQLMNWESKQDKDQKIAKELSKISKETIQKLVMMSEMVKTIQFNQ